MMDGFSSHVHPGSNISNIPSPTLVRETKLDVIPPVRLPPSLVNKVQHGIPSSVLRETDPAITNLCIDSILLASELNQGILVTTRGELNVVEMPTGTQDIMKILDCNHFQSVPCTEGLMQNLSINIWLDEEAVDSKPVNTLATMMFGEEVFSNVLHGDVFLCMDGSILTR